VAIGVIAGGTLFGAVPALAALVSHNVTYLCGNPVAPHTFKVEMAGPATNPTPRATVVVTWKIAQPVTGSTLVAPTQIPAGNQVEIEGHAVASGTAVPVASANVTAKASATQAVAVPPGGPLPLPTMLVTVVPTTTGTVVVRPDGFVLKAGPAAAGAAQTALVTCNPAAVAEAALAQATFTVGGSASPSPTPTPTPTPTKSATPTPQTTHTVYKTVTHEATKTERVTPKGGAATGGGGEAGPDGRLFIGIGSVLILGAVLGGMVLRRRRLTQG
jgi:hypothetical protein